MVPGCLQTQLSDFFIAANKATGGIHQAAYVLIRVSLVNMHGVVLGFRVTNGQFAWRNLD